MTTGITEQAASVPMGYRPLKLTLTGFKGIRSGLGRDSLTLDLDELVGESELVAIAGANGRGKTTVMDNLHPYLVMPSRSGADGLGGFSYYEHVYLPESQKELVWQHRGRVYESHLVFRLNGKRKTEAFLFELEGSGLKPVVLIDGTASDGKVETYERAVAEILGSRDTFFTSVFSAQGKRPLSAFKNGEIKGLLADLLGLDHVREHGAKAAEVVRLLKSGLGLIRQDQKQADESIAQLLRDAASLGEGEAAVLEARDAKQQRTRRLDQARESLASANAAAQAANATEARRAELATERRRLTEDSRAAVGRIDEEGRRIEQRAAAVDQRAVARRRSHAERRARLLQQLEAHRRIARQARRVAHAAGRVGLAARVVALRDERAAAAQAEAEQVEKLRGQLRLHQQGAQGIEREAGQLALRQADLARRFGLAEAVPCAGTDLQGRCQLLGDAREAQALRPSVDGQMGALVERKRSLLDAAAAIGVELAKRGDAAERRNRAERLLETAQARLNALQLLAAKEGEVQQAARAQEAAEAELAALPEAVPHHSEEEAAELADIAAARERCAAERARIAEVLAHGLGRADNALAALPPAFDARCVANAQTAVGEAERALRAAENQEAAAVRRHEQQRALHAQIERAQVSRREADARAAHVEQELSAWTLLAKCLSNDGVIALDIDDAGPTFSALANDLLMACYGPRFTLEVITQSQTAKGELREDFDIIVHDGLRDDSKSLRLVSGGERVWINECLTRAIALYLAGNTGREYGTLFCDEADGPLDAERKRMFMAMKREVLRLGGYAREFFVSQTPELTAMADAVIDLDGMAVRQEEQSAGSTTPP